VKYVGIAEKASDGTGWAHAGAHGAPGAF